MLQCPPHERRFQTQGRGWIEYQAAGEKTEVGKVAFDENRVGSEAFSGKPFHLPGRRQQLRLLRYGTKQGRDIGAVRKREFSHGLRQLDAQAPPLAPQRPARFALGLASSQSAL